MFECSAKSGADYSSTNVAKHAFLESLALHTVKHDAGEIAGRLAKALGGESKALSELVRNPALPAAAVAERQVSAKVRRSGLRRGPRLAPD